MNGCTEFCTRLKAIAPTDGALPSHDGLVAHLQFTADDRELGRYLGEWQELQQRTECGFCQLVVAAVASHASGAEIARDQPISVLVFPGEQSFRLSYPSRLGARLAFVARDGGPKPGGPDTARLVDGSSIDVSVISRWLRSCDESHEGCQLEPFDPVLGDEAPARFNRRRFNEEATSNFRVIDLKLGCVGPAALHVRYVALSYVWGHLPMFRLQRKNFERLSVEGGLGAIWDELPRTIRDAIDLVRALGERYLWVDGLCLVQDDENDMSMGIEQMNSIYHGSYLTIVAASGADASAGLPGAGAASSRQNRQIVRDVGGGSGSLQMAVLHSIDWHLRRSVYSQRGWTLQEITLPQRTVIFVNDQVYFRCREANWGEDSWADGWARWLDPDDSNISRIPDLGDGFLPSLWAFQKLCEDYSLRRLRSDGDALRAAVGFLRPLAAGMETVLIEGLPGYYLDHFLLFISPSGDLRRRAGFASFSWAGWAGAVAWPRENYVWHETTGERTWDVANIRKFFRHRRLVKWNALDSKATLENLSFRPWDKPSLLVELMRQHPTVFPGADMDPERDRSAFPGYSTVGMSSSGLPHWDENYYPDVEATDLDVTGLGTGPKDRFTVRGFDLANGEAEFYRLVRRLSDPMSILDLQNWMAQRHAYLSQVGKDGSKIGPRSLARGEKVRHYQVRERNPATPNGLNSASEKEDPRERQARFLTERRAPAQAAKAAKPFPIPKFPPYTVLQFITISMHLVLGTSPQQRTGYERPDLGVPGPTRSLFDRIPGIPLHSATDQIVGSLHPDNVDLLGPPGSKIECLIVSRCTTPTVASALQPTDTEAARDEEKDRPWDLFWVLVVAWLDGIAERRGVAQVLTSALETAVEPAPEVKLVLLG